MRLNAKASAEDGFSVSVENNVNATTANAYDIGNGVVVDIDDVIYHVTESCNSDYTRQAYKTSFNRFMKVINIQDLQVLRDLGPKVMEQMVIKYVINARDVKKLSRASIQAECNAVYHFCELNDLTLNKKKIRRFFSPDESAHDDRLYTDREMQRIILACSKREKVIILLMVSAGIRIGTGTSSNSQRS